MEAQKHRSPVACPGPLDKIWVWLAGMAWGEEETDAAGRLCLPGLLAMRWFIRAGYGSLRPSHYANRELLP